MTLYTYTTRGFYVPDGGLQPGTAPGTYLMPPLEPITITDDDEQMSESFDQDPTEAISVGSGEAYAILQNITYKLSFTNPSGDAYSEDFFFFGVYAPGGGYKWIVMPLPDSQLEDGAIITSTGLYTPSDGGSWSNVTCFCAGTNIQTINGDRKIDSIRIGDLVKTKAGFSKVRWIGRRALELEELRANPKLFPVRIKAGALGSGMPKQDLLVSRQHRMMVYSNVARRMFGDAEVLVSAIRLTDLPGIYVDEHVESIEYLHLLFDQHEIIYAEGAPSESLYLGAETIKTMSQEALEEILAIFPELANTNFKARSAHHIPPGKLQKKLVSRHAKNGKSLLLNEFASLV